MEKSIEKEIREVLNQSVEETGTNESLSPEDSPLNIPVAENATTVPPEERQPDFSSDEHTEQEEPYFESEPEDGVPEQEIGNGNFEENLELTEEEGFELPTGHAKQAADTILGMADNVLEVGGGFLVKIKKHQGFYDFEEVIQLIDEQNEKNVRRIKLDKEDKILLSPLLIAILKRKAKQLTPEQQLMGAILSILMKKTQMVFEIRAENEMLTQKILEVIREEKGAEIHAAKEETEPVKADEPTSFKKENKQTIKTDGATAEDSKKAGSSDSFENQVMETA